MIRTIVRALKREVSRKIAYVIIGVISAFVISFVSNNFHVGAVSAYDDYVQKTDKLLVQSNTACGGKTLDITNNWASTLLQDDYISLDTRNSFQNALNNGRWAVSQEDLSSQ